MNLNHITNKQDGDQLTALEWNKIASDVNELGANSGGGSVENTVTVTEDQTASDPTANVAIVSGVTQIGSPNVIRLTKKKKGVNTTVTSENNINIEPRESVGTTKGGNISFKPGDDIEFCSHHRVPDSQDEVSIKVIDGDDIPVKLQLNAASMTITTKDKTGDDANVFDVNVNSNKNTKGYLKVRAQAIDLRCEANGGIALQPKGNDGSGHENKIKFEHNGGDGVEFGTFNTQHTSIFTNEYRFNEFRDINAYIDWSNSILEYKSTSKILSELRAKYEIYQHNIEMISDFEQDKANKEEQLQKYKDTHSLNSKEIEFTKGMIDSINNKMDVYNNYSALYNEWKSIDTYIYYNI